MRLADPWALLLLLLPLALGWYRWRARRRPPAAHLAFPALPFLAGVPASRRARWRWLLPALRAAAIALIAVALARPQAPHDVREITRKSRNVVVALDISSSMKAGDFQPGNRLEVARRVLTEFVRRREGDLLGLVVFAKRAFLQAPLTPDLALLEQTLGRVDIGLLPDGTAIGSALAMSLNQLKDLPVRASTVVLITDGANNTGQPTPAQAAEAARALGIRVHAIGLSTADTTSIELNGVWRVGNTAPRLTRWDEAVLQGIAERTGGRFFRATDPEGLERILEEIDRAERIDVRIGETRDYRELFPLLLAPALLLLGLELTLGATWLRTLP